MRAPSVAPPIGLDDDPDRELRTKDAPTPNPRTSSVPPIGPAKRRGRPRKAMIDPSPSAMPPSVAPIDQDYGSDRGRRASKATTPNQEAPAAPPIGHNGNAVVGGDGQLSLDSHTDAAISATINELIGAQKLRRFAITEKNRSERAIEALIAGFMGFRIDATEKERKAVYARAKAFRLASEEGKTNDDHDNHNLAALVPTIIVSSASRQQWWNLKEMAEKDLKHLAKRLPVYDFANGVRGFGALGLAVLTAEAGMPIGDYPTVSKLWKRMGLAVMGDKDQWVADGDGWERIGEPARNDKRQQKCRDEVEAIIHGYVPRRRAEVWAFCSDSMFRGQWKGANEETGEPAGPRGPYGEVYARRRAHTEPRIAATAHLPAGNREKWTPGRCHNDARRIMSKALLRDLWRVWRGMPPRGSSPID